MAETAAPVLAPPGAGVPLPDRLVMRYILRPFVARRSAWEENEARFRAVAARIEAEIKGLSPGDMTRQILVPPMRGLEDSSRNWSVAMTLEHIAIVSRAIAGAVRALAAGAVPPGRADTAAVKPSGGLGPEEAAESFRRFCNEEFPALLPALRNRDSSLAFAHPWFGPMTAKEWHWLLAAHLDIHLRQIREIRRRL